MTILLTNPSVGNFLQIFNRKGWDFNEEIAKKFGGAIRTFGLFGVCAHYDTPNPLVLTLWSLQRDQLYTFDPLALHHIFVKNQYVYEETEVFLLYVWRATWAVVTVNTYQQAESACLRMQLVVHAW